MKKAASHILFALASAGLCVVFAGRISAASSDYVITYTDLVPSGAPGGGLSFTSGDLQGGSIGGRATIWTGPGFTAIDLHPANLTSSEVLGGAGNQQVGYTYNSRWPGPRAALWNGSVASLVNLNPSWSLHSLAYATTGTQQVGSATATIPFFQVRAGLWSGTEESFVDLHPGGVSSTAYAMAGNQQGGMVNYNGAAHAALWTGTAASYRDLHPLGQLEHSRILGMTTNQQVGDAGGHAGIWFGTAGSFRDLHPAGADFSEAHATIDTMQVGYATYDFSGRAILWLGSADNYLDLHLVLGSQFRDSDANSIWTDGSTILVAGTARDRVGLAHPILWNIIAACSISCPTNLVVCADPGECGAVVQFPAPVASHCTGLNIECVPPSGSFFPVGTNHVTCVAKDPNGQIEDSCSFQVVVRDCEPPVIHGLSASPRVLWPPNNRMQPVRVTVTATDNCELASCKIISVINKEPKPSAGVRDSKPDWQLTGDLTLNLRAERSRGGKDRIYTIAIQCTDVAGNASTRTVSVTVPHDQRAKQPTFR